MLGDRGLQGESLGSSEWSFSVPRSQFPDIFSVFGRCFKAFYTQIQAARETGALKEAKDKLEKRVEELTWRLGLEKRMRVITVLYV